MKDLEKKQQFIELRAKDKSFASIAEEIGVSKTTLIEWSKDLTEEIHNLRAIEMESLMKRYEIGKEHHLKAYTERLNKIREELSKRDFKRISTTKLIELEVKTLESLDKEEVQLYFKKTVNNFDLNDPMKTLHSWSA